MKSIFVVLLCCVSVASGFFWGSEGPAWNSLRTTWGLNPFSGNTFQKQPLTIEDAKAAGFEQIPGQCDGKYLGQRFIQGKDVSLILIYDTKGNVAGAQMALPKSMATSYYNFTNQKMFNEDNIGGVDVFILTAYFVDPTTICSKDNIPNRKEGATGTGLWLQNGPDPVRDSMSVPLTQTGLNSTKWVQGQCFVSMGVHYWYDNRLDLDCNFFFPSFLLYNQGELTGFGWSIVGKYDYSKHTEFPPLAALSAFLKPVPTCMPDKFTQSGGFTTMHLYFNAEPWNLLC